MERTPEGGVKNNNNNKKKQQASQGQIEHVACVKGQKQKNVSMGIEPWPIGLLRTHDNVCTENNKPDRNKMNMWLV